MLYRTTLDVDTNDKEFIIRLISKIVIKCKILSKHLIDFEMKESKCKGYHFILFCNRKCDICRMVYDDSTRFYYDSYRPEWARNILFDKTEKIKP